MVKTVGSLKESLNPASLSASPSRDQEAPPRRRGSVTKEGGPLSAVMARRAIQGMEENDPETMAAAVVGVSEASALPRAQINDLLKASQSAIQYYMARAKRVEPELGFASPPRSASAAERGAAAAAADAAAQARERAAAEEERVVREDLQRRAAAAANAAADAMAAANAAAAAAAVAAEAVYSSPLSPQQRRQVRLPPLAGSPTDPARAHLFAGGASAPIPTTPPRSATRGPPARGGSRGGAQQTHTDIMDSHRRLEEKATWVQKTWRSHRARRGFMKDVEALIAREVHIPPRSTSPSSGSAGGLGGRHSSVRRSREGAPRSEGGLGGGRASTSPPVSGGGSAAAAAAEAARVAREARRLF